MKPVIERFLSKISISNSGCWEWNGYIQENGYGQTSIKSKGVYTHRFIYEYYHDSIHPDLTIDHLCRNRKCVNPLHLEQVSHKENIMRGDTLALKNSKKTHCKRGHEFTPKNTYVNPRGSRCCMICTNYLKRLTYKNNKLQKQ